MKCRIVALPILLVLSSLGYSNDDPVIATASDDFVPPEFVYVPGDGHETNLVIEIIGDVSVRSAAKVSARAISGPWMKVRYSDIEPCSTWFVRPLNETDITGSVEWRANSPGMVRFGTVTEVTPEASYKSIQFDLPGEYEITASTTFPTEATSNTIHITVGQ
jgi:hypothetical protein